MLANAEISIATGDIKKAISILKGVTKDSSYFVESRKILADVYLNHLKERRFLFILNKLNKKNILKLDNMLNVMLTLSKATQILKILN